VLNSERREKKKNSVSAIEKQSPFFFFSLPAALQQFSLLQCPRDCPITLGGSLTRFRWSENVRAILDPSVVLVGQRPPFSASQ
jgi:hypothetical protein